MAKLSDPKENNFNLLRLVAAVSVIFSHAHEIIGDGHDYLHQWFGYSGGWVAVSAFFSISGFLIYLSMTRGQSIRNFLIARCLRIFPGLWVMLLISIITLGSLISSKPMLDFFSSSDTLFYVLGNGGLYFPKYQLPGVFNGLPLDGVVNGSLWTLRFEFTCYLIVLILYVSGLLKTERRFVAFTSIYLFFHFAYLAYSSKIGRLDNLLYDGSDASKLYRLFFAFFLGMVVARYIHVLRVQFWMIPVSLLICWASWGTALFMSSIILFIAIFLFWVAFLQVEWLVPFRSMHDYSYGIYVYAFPVQQVFQAIFPQHDAIWNSLLSLIATVPLAAMSWHFIESPCLRMKNIFKNRAESK